MCTHSRHAAMVAIGYWCMSGTINKQDIKIILAVSGDNDVSSESGSGRDDAAAAACIKL